VRPICLEHPSTLRASGGLDPYAAFRNAAQNVSRTTPAMCRRRVSEDAGAAFPNNDTPTVSKHCVTGQIHYLGLSRKYCLRQDMPYG
jgi:hypothetical protein